MKPYTFTNGVHITKGTRVFSPLIGIHLDENIYSNPHEFDGFRFSKLRERDGESAKHHSSNTSSEYLQFGHGQHAW
jgi:cytochrome P450